MGVGWSLGVGVGEGREGGMGGDEREREGIKRYKNTLTLKSMLARASQLS